MRLSEYLSFKYKGGKIDSPYQYQAKQGAQYYEQHPMELESELTENYRWWMYSPEVKKSQRFGFLDYNMNLYGGDPMDFWDFVKNSPGEGINADRDAFSDHVLKEINKYVEPKTEWLELRKAYAYSNPFTHNNTYTKGDKQDLAINGAEGYKDNLCDHRIKGNLTIDEVEDYFLKAFFTDTKTPIMSREDVIHFLRANFQGFKPIVQPRLLETNCKQTELRRIIRRFFEKHYTQYSEAQVYCQMMKDNFKVFANTSLESLKSNFSKA